MEGRNLVQSLESADRDASTLLATLSTRVNAVNLSHQPRNIHNSKKPESPCYRCGEPHFDRDSRFKDAECRNCRKKGHIARTCRSKPPIQNSQSRQPRWRQQTNLLTKDPPEDADSDPDTDPVYYLFTILNRSAKPLRVNVQLIHTPLSMEVESVSVISRNTYNKFWLSAQAPHLEHSVVRLQT